MTAPAIYQGYTSTPANANLDALWAQVGVSLYPVQPGEIAGQVVNPAFEPGDIFRYGGIPDGTATGGTDCGPAFNRAFLWAVTGGGKVRVRGGSYYHNTPIVCDYTLKFVKVEIEGTGAELYSGPAITGSAIKIIAAPGPHGIVVRGLKANHRNNTIAAAFIELNGCSNSLLENITVERHNTKTDYASVLMTALTPGNDNTCCFWTTIRNLKTRMRGSDGTWADADVWLKGAHNATIITESALSHSNKTIRITSDGVGTSLPNGVVIDRNAFETIGNAVDVTAPSAADYWLAGLRIVLNRVESATTFLNLVATAGSALTHSMPTYLFGNYCTNGSVTNWVNNPNNAPLTVLESVSFGVSTPNVLHNMAPFRMVFNSAVPGSNLLLSDEGGISNWQRGHLQLGEDAVSSIHIWLNTANGYLMCKQGSAPTSATDGVVIAANGAALPVPGLIITTPGGRIVPGTGQLSIRDNANANDNLILTDAGVATVRAGVTVTSGPLRHQGTTVGFYNKAPVVQAAAITTPNTQTGAYVQADVQSLKTAIDAIRVALQGVGITL